MSTVAVQVINEKGEAKGFCRAGIAFGPDWGFYEVDGGQLERITAEPRLRVAGSSAKLTAPAAVELLRRTADLVLINEFYDKEKRKAVVAAVEERIGELKPKKKKEPEKDAG